MPIKPVAKTYLIGEVVAGLEQLISSEEYRPGDRLPSIKELTKSFGVGLTTVREALRHLESVGLIRIQHGAGIFVTDKVNEPLLVRPILTSGVLKPSITKDLLAVRKMLETGAAELAARNASDAEIEHLRAVYKSMALCLDDPHAFSEQNTLFHMVISEISGNKIVILMLKAVRDMILQNQERLNISDKLRRDSLTLHSHILEAIAQHDPVEARKQMDIHLERIQQSVGN